MLPTSLPGGSPARDHVGPTDFGPRARARRAAACARLRAACGRRARRAGRRHSRRGRTRGTSSATHRRATPPLYARADAARHSADRRLRSSAVLGLGGMRGVRRRRRRRRRRTTADAPTTATRPRRPRRPTRDAESTPATTTSPDLAALRASRSTEVVGGLDSPVAIAIARAATTSDLRRRAERAASASSTTARSSAIRCSTGRQSRPGNEQGLLGLTFSPDGTLLYVELHRPGRRHPRRRVHDGRRRRRPVDAPRELLFVDQPYREPQRRRGRSSAPTTCSTSGSATAAPAATRRTTRAGPRRRSSARSCASIRRRRRRAVHDPGRQPVRRPGRRASRDLDVRAAQPVALLVRPRDRRRLDRRRRPERVGGDRLHDARRRARQQLGLGRARRRTRVRRRRAGRTRATRSSRLSHDDGNCSVDRRLRLPRPSDPRAARRVRVRRLLPARAHRPRATGRSRSSRNSRLGASGDSVTSFGEDADGELYVLVARRQRLPHRPA